MGRPVPAGFGPAFRDRAAFDRGGGVPLYRQLYDALRQAILDGRLKPGARLPPSRDLAREWGLSRNTVLTAYDLLLAEGYAGGRVGAGTFVAASLPERPAAAEFATETAAGAPAAPARRIGPSARWRALTALPPGRPGSAETAFALGVPALDAFPHTLWARLMAGGWRSAGRRLAGETDPLGYPPLRAAVAEHLRAVRAVRCEPEQVAIVSGSQQALSLLAQLLIDPGDTVWTEDPGWHGAQAALTTAGARPVPVPVDGEGMDIAEGLRRAAHPRLILVTPSHQFPLGVTMSLPRRLALLELAAASDAWILEDDYDSEFRYAGPPLTALQGLDRAGRVIYVGSFSKAIFPALRLGYAVVPPDLVDAMRAARRWLDGGTGVVAQMALARFMAEGHFASHLRAMRTLYAGRRQALLDALRRHFDGEPVEAVPGDAGIHVVLRLPPGVDDVQASARAAAAGLRCPPLSRWHVRRPDAGGLVLGFAAHPEEVLEAAVAVLARVLRE